MNSTSDLETPAIPWREVWPELIAVVVAVLIPPLLLVFDLAERQADLFQRGGLISLFIVVVLQFKALSDLNRKHVLNAVRAKRGELVLGISPTRTNLGWLTLLVAIYASTVAAFGDKFVDALLRVFYA